MYQPFTHSSQAQSEHSGHVCTAKTRANVCNSPWTRQKHVALGGRRLPRLDDSWHNISSLRRQPASTSHAHRIRALHAWQTRTRSRKGCPKMNALCVQPTTTCAEVFCFWLCSLVCVCAIPPDATQPHPFMIHTIWSYWLHPGWRLTSHMRYGICYAICMHYIHP